MKSTKKALLISKLIITIIFLTSSCGANSEKQNSDSSLEDVDVISIAEITPSKLSDVVDDIGYTALKYHPEHRAYRIDKVLIEDGLIYIFDYYSGRSLSVYDLKGNFQFAITKPGEGPDQYLSVQDFLIDKGKIEVLDTRGKLVFYDNQGAFERSEKLPFSARAFLKTSNDYLFQTGKIPNELGENGKPCEVVQYNLETKKTDCQLEIHNGKNPHSFKERNILKNIGGITYYSTYFNDTIYRKQGDKFTPRFIMKFSSNALPTETLDSNQPISDFTETLKDKVYHNPDLQGNSEFLITRFKSSGNSYLINNDKEGKSSIIKSTAKNDVDGGLPLYWIHSVNKDNLIMIIDSQYVMERANKLQQEKSEFNEKERAFLDFASNLSIEDPLVMIAYHLK
ncbi:hypothetical protein OB69_02240 [Roseivirga seohaensis subsp. aquiponti]|uniref:6-bladed beta-propeller n=1 Tax=Roseivirga seohaensis subsp. aquiponti TaxID=1566026 RepID=A0A0L8APE2_9BACT|nr:6-bladed beta-propeller [Roseivirga seohaensis]KOF04353.1 hypothetical protein OB69_02240 [Roseivirga seohaensis subsp. aquiponti]